MKIDLNLEEATLLTGIVNAELDNVEHMRKMCFGISPELDRYSRQLLALWKRILNEVRVPESRRLERIANEREKEIAADGRD